MTKQSSSKRKRVWAAFLLLLWKKVASASTVAAMRWSAMMGRIVGTVLPEVHLGGTVAGVGSAAGCLMAVALFMVLIVGAVYLASRLGSPSVPTQPATTQSHRPPARGGSTADQSFPGVAGGAADTVSSSTGATLTEQESRSSQLLDEAELQRQRLRAAANSDIEEYNRLVQQHRALYAQKKINPCTSGFFPQGCSRASGEAGAEPSTSQDGEQTAGAGAGAQSPAEEPEDDPETAVKRATAGNMQRQVERGHAPKSVDRVDRARFPKEKDQVHFKDGNALNWDGSWKHGGRPLTNAEKEWLVENGWKLPK